MHLHLIFQLVPVLLIKARNVIKKVKVRVKAKLKKEK